MLPILAGIVLAAIIVSCITFKDHILKFFHKAMDKLRGCKDLTDQDQANVAFTLKSSLASGEFTVVSGIFNKNTGEIASVDSEIQAQKYQSKKIDKDLEGYHGDKELVIYE